MDDRSTPPAARLRVGTDDNARWLLPLLGLVGAGALWLRAVGLPGTDLQGPLHQAGIMAPSCGGTRATYVLLRGDLAGAWSWNPLVPILALIVVAVTVRTIVGFASGRWLNLSLARRVWVPVCVVGLTALEVNQQLQAERLTTVVPA